MYRLLDLLLHADDYLIEIAHQYGPEIYFLLFVVIFSETGFVIMPFLPGEGLLFAVGVVTAAGDLSLFIVIPLLIAAAYLGNLLNYHLGRALGPELFTKGRIPWLQEKHLKRTKQFYDRYGQQAVILSRFVPYVRSIIPFLAGMTFMNRRAFHRYNAIGAVGWVVLVVCLGYFLGHLPVVRRHFTWIIVAMVLLSWIPILQAGLRLAGGRKEKESPSGR